MKRHIAIVAVLLTTLAFTPSADAQLLWRWFGPKTPDKAPAGKSSLLEQRRITEANIEIAWLADPVTFPYYLEAHATAKELEVRGYVPNKAVREHAVRIAKVYSSLPVVDSTKEHPSLLVKPGQMSPQQLQASVQSSLRVALPKQHQHLKVEVGDDGKVFVMGPVANHEERVAVSQSLRRLHGCTSVQNLTSLPAELANSERTPIVKTSSGSDSKGDKPGAAPENKSRWPLWPFAKAPGTATRDEPPLLDRQPGGSETKEPPLVQGKKPNLADGPVLIPNVADVKPMAPKNEVVKVQLPPPAAKGPALSAPELQKRIKAAWPNAKTVEVEFTSATEVRITLEIRDEKDLTPAAERVFALPELERYRSDLQFRITPP